jgi:hypothetical protein
MESGRIIVTVSPTFDPPFESTDGSIIEETFGRSP